VARSLSGDDGAWALTAYALNPSVLIETAGMGHNESIMIALALGGLLCYQNGRPWLAFIALLLSADIKQVTAALGLLLAVHFVFSLPDAKGRVRRALGILAMAIALEFMLWFPFWKGRQMFTPASQIIFDVHRLGPGASVASTKPTVAVGFAILVLIGAAMAARCRLVRVIDIATALMLVFVWFIFPWPFPWYLIPPLALLAVNSGAKIGRFLLFVTITRCAYLSGIYLSLHPLIGRR